MSEVSPLIHSSAVRDFREARRKAAMQDILARLTGKSHDLLSYEEVSRLLKARGAVREGLREISLDAIVGSVGRYNDFTRSFLPRRANDEDRWARVKLKTVYEGGLPPIEVYQIGDAYFVLDGNHRVSVARALGASTIQAYVTRVPTKAPLTPDVEPDDLIVKARYVEFLERTGLDRVRPDADLSMTAPGRYRQLEEQIERYRQELAYRSGGPVSKDEAVGLWYDEVYFPVIEVIRGQGILRDFPGRTETDLYVWVCKHRQRLAEELGWNVDPESAAADLASRFSLRPQRVAARLGERILDAVTPDEFEAGPAPGKWRRQQQTHRRLDHLFSDLLVPVSGTESGWAALDQAIIVGRREHASLHGLHVVADDMQKADHHALAVQAEFKRRCQADGMSGNLAIQAGNIARLICDRARWVDLIVLHVAHPPAPQPFARLSSGLRTLLRRCSRPILAVKDRPTLLKRALLAYDGSSKAREALYVAAYLAGQWKMVLTVVTVQEDGRDRPDVLSGARDYLLKQGLEAVFLLEHGYTAEAILRVAHETASDLIIMGGYGFSPVLEVVLGSTVDEVLRTSSCPLLVCR